MRISKKKVISFIILLLFLVSLIWGAVYLKKVSEKTVENALKGEPQNMNEKVR